MTSQWKVVNYKGEVIKEGSGAIPAISSLPPGAIITSVTKVPDGPSVEARLKILEDRADVHAEQISRLMNTARLAPHAPVTTRPLEDEKLTVANLSALEQWTRPDSWTFAPGTAAEEQRRTYELVAHLNGLVRTAQRGERVLMPGEPGEPGVKKSFAP